MMDENDNILPFALGTVQLGVPYGLNNQTGMPSGIQSRDLLDAAWGAGIRCFDTARAYGKSEKRIGRWMAKRSHHPEIITKVPAIEARLSAADDLTEAVNGSISQSTEALGHAPDGVLLHNAGDLFRPGVAVALKKAQDRKRIGAFGVSVYDPDQLRMALKLPSVTMVQLPSNLLDFRFHQAGLLQECQSRGVRVFIRSVYLQGALLMDPSALPAHLKDLKAPLTRLRGLADDLDMPLAALAVLGVLAQSGDVTPVMGAETPDQIVQTLDLYRQHNKADIPLNDLINIAEGLSQNLINPGRWPKTA